MYVKTKTEGLFEFSSNQHGQSSSVWCFQWVRGQQPGILSKIHFKSSNLNVTNGPIV